MIYPYSSENRLESPHSYMYAPYYGRDFIYTFIEERLRRLKSHLHVETVIFPEFLIDALIDQANIFASDVQLDEFSVHKTYSLQLLLDSSLNGLINCNNATTTQWLNRIVQRFEVTKKLFSSYSPGFRKGLGNYHDPILYYKLALCLSLSYSMSANLQYLSTLLKLNDLLLSLDSKVLGHVCSSEFLTVLVAYELQAVSSLAESHGVNINAE